MRSRYLPCSIATLTLVLGACSGGSEQVQLPPVDENLAKQAEATSVVSPHPDFSTPQTLDGSKEGLIGDGTTVNTEVFRRMLAGGKRKIRIHKGDYLTGSLVIDSDTVLELEAGTTLRDTGELAQEEAFITIPSQNVRINGTGARVIANRADYTTGEGRHGVNMSGARNVVIVGLESSGHGGDGFYIGGPAGQPSTDITLRGCKAYNNRRQGLSITSARRVRVVDCEFIDANGTPPQFGIDLEPNFPIDTLDDIVILRPSTSSNVGGGIMIALAKLDSTSEHVSITIVDHKSTDEYPPLKLMDLRNEAFNIHYSGAP